MLTYDTKACLECPYAQDNLRTCMWGEYLNPSSPPDRKIMIIMNNAMYDKPFRGQFQPATIGKQMTALLRDSGFAEFNPYLTYAIRCRSREQPVDDSPPTLNRCVRYMEHEIAQIRPELIIAMGKIPFKELCGFGSLDNNEGAPIYSDKAGCTVFPCYPPTYLRAVPEYTDHMLQTFRNIKSYIISPDLPKPNYVIADTFQKVDALFKKMKSITEFSCDIESTGFDFHNDRILCVSFSWKKGTAAVLPLLGYKEKKIWSDEIYEYIMKKLKELLEDPDKYIIMQNGAFDVGFFKAKGINVAGFKFDTMLAHHLIDENVVDSHGLKSIARHYTHMGNYEDELNKTKAKILADKKKAAKLQKDVIRADETLTKEEKRAKCKEIDSIKITMNYSEIPTKLLWHYAGADADVTHRVKHTFMEKFEEEFQAKGGVKHLKRLFNKIVMPARNVLNEMEYRGALINPEQINELDIKYSKEIDELSIKARTYPEIHEVEERLYQLTTMPIGERFDNLKKPPKNVTRTQYIEKYTKRVDFNLNSPKQLALLLFKVLGLKPLSYSKKTKEPSTDVETLNHYREKYEVVGVLADNRKVQKAHGTYVVGMRALMDPNNRVHTDFNQHITVTGRLSSSKPNLQNIPRKSEVKKLFVAPPGYRLVQFDFSQAEFRMWAFESQDPKMINDIISGMDIHAQTAADFWKIPLADVTKDQRQQAKFVVFGLMYGRGAASVAKQVGISEEEAQGIIDYFFGKYPVAARWLETTHGFAKIHKYVVNHFGRIRRLPTAGFTEREYKEMYAEAMRQSVNAPIQGGASDVTMITLVRVWNLIQKHNFKSFPTLTVHDSIIFEVPDEEIQTFVPLAYHEMVRPVEGINVPFEVEIQVSEIEGNWNELEEMVFNEDNVLVFKDEKKAA